MEDDIIIYELKFPNGDLYIGYTNKIKLWGFGRAIV